MSETLLRNRDYTIILARNASRTSPAPPGLEKLWLVAQESVIVLAKKCEEFDPDGITIYIASTPLQKYESETSNKLAELFQGQYASENINLLEALRAALNDYFSRKARGKTKENGEIITVILDDEPGERMAIIKLLVEATHKMDNQEELGIMFAQVGDDLIARGFLTALDDDLHRADAKFNLADTVILARMEESATVQLLLNALYG
ncbi:hypothetical protein [Lyngbya aestuarii]|uniref:hypothetical protein n=1 Tax=Lyngbya aestuarii TaxID=118322 RepID=UPI00403DFE1B